MDYLTNLEVAHDTDKVYFVMIIFGTRITGSKYSAELREEPKGFSIWTNESGKFTFCVYVRDIEDALDTMEKLCKHKLNPNLRTGTTFNFR